MDPSKFSGLEPAKRAAESKGAEEAANGASRLSGLSLPGVMSARAKTVSKYAMRTGAGPDASKLSEQYGIPEGLSLIVRGVVRLGDFDEVPDEPPAGGDILIGLYKLVRGSQ